MAKFIYKMQNVLDIRLKVEDQAKTAFSTAMERLREEEEKHRLLLEKKRNYEEEYREATKGRLNAMELNMWRTGIEKTKSDIKEQLVNIKVANKNLELARFKLEEAIKERKVQEKLKEKAFEEFKHELNQQESKEVDELVSYQYGNKSDTGGEI